MDFFLGLPRKLLTLPDKLGISRLQTDVGSTGFFDNRESRYFREFDIPAGVSWWIKVVVPADGIILKTQEISVDTGAVRFRAWRGLNIDADFVGPGTPADVHTNEDALVSGYFRQNNLPSAPDYTMLTDITESLAANQAVSGGTCSESKRLRTSGATAQRISVGLNTTDERGIDADTYYLQLQNIGSGNTTGEYVLKFEERTGAG